MAGRIPGGPHPDTISQLDEDFFLFFLLELGEVCRGGDRNVSAFHFTDEYKTAFVEDFFGATYGALAHVEEVGSFCLRH